MLKLLLKMQDRAKANPDLSGFKGRIMQFISAVKGVGEENVQPELKADIEAFMQEMESVESAPKGDKHQKDFDRIASSLSIKPTGMGAVFSQVHKEVEKKEIDPEVAERNARLLDGEDLKPDIVKNDVAELKNGKLQAIKQTFADLGGKTGLSGAQIEKLYTEMINATLNDNECRAQLITRDPEFCGDLLAKAQSLGLLTMDTLAGFGEESQAAATALVFKRSTTNFSEKQKVVKGKAVLGEAELNTWVLETLPPEAFNKTKDGLGPRVINNLWNSGDFDLICNLIEHGVDASEAFSLPMATSAGHQEGVWSGFVQPIEHLLGNYIKLVYQFDQNPDQFDEAMQKKIAGAKKILKTLDETDTAILTSYEQISNCQAMKVFEEDPGTVWGFEDVRLPFVQAARDKKKGDEPLRMIELWAAVEKAIERDGYDLLLQDPDKAIKKFTKIGIAAMKKTMAEKQKHYESADHDEYLKQFEIQVDGYLRHLANQIPKGQFENATLSGMDSGKLMGGLACNAGLWWAKEEKKKVYYCLDGLNIDEALDYKAYKNKRIAAHFDDEHNPKHAEVITFGEIREILKNWDDLAETVYFIKQGVIIEDKSQFETWRDTMKANDEKAGKRPAPPSQTFQTKLDEIGVDKLWDAIEGEDYEAMKVAVKFDTLKKRVALMANLDILPRYLREKGAFLVKYKIVPANMADIFESYLLAVRANDGSEDKKSVTQVITALPASLKPEITGWVDRVDKLREK